MTPASPDALLAADVERVAKGLTKAQRAIVERATWAGAGGVWHPEGWYVHGNRRVRWNLCRMNITRDYLRHFNRLTPLGLAIRHHLTTGATHHE